MERKKKSEIQSIVQRKIEHMLIPRFCSIARKGIRELDTTEKENHHGEKDYAFFFPRYHSLRLRRVCDERKERIFR